MTYKKHILPVGPQARRFREEPSKKTLGLARGNANFYIEGRRLASELFLEARQPLSSGEVADTAAPFWLKSSAGTV